MSAQMGTQTLLHSGIETRLKIVNI